MASIQYVYNILSEHLVAKGGIALITPKGAIVFKPTNEAVAIEGLVFTAEGSIMIRVRFPWVDDLTERVDRAEDVPRAVDELVEQLYAQAPPAPGIEPLCVLLHHYLEPKGGGAGVFEQDFVEFKYRQARGGVAICRNGFEIYIESEVLQTSNWACKNRGFGAKMG